MQDKIHNKILDHLHNFYENNPFVELLDIKIETVAYGIVILSLKARKELSNFYRIAHGGALMSLADTAMGATCLSANKKVVTQTMTCQFIKAVPEDTQLFAAGHIIHNGRKTMVCETKINDSEGTLYCQATGNFFVIGEYFTDGENEDSTK